jgi:hypothetical protein
MLPVDETRERGRRRFARCGVWLLLATALLLSACVDAPTTDDDERAAAAGDARVRAVIDSARAAAGADVLDRGARVSFTFRGDRFALRRRGDGTFSYARTAGDSLGRRIRDVLTADTLRRRIDGRSAPLDSAARRRIETAVNSVAYFALLPVPLGDPAVEPRYAGTDTLGGTPYHRVAVTFRQQGGGRDWQDRFVYWFDRRDFSMDYLAYAYGLGAGDDYGTRFREAFNVRRVGGVRFADYRNYTTCSNRLPPDQLARYGRLFEADSLRRVSTVALDSVRVE